MNCSGYSQKKEICVFRISILCIAYYQILCHLSSFEPPVLRIWHHSVWLAHLLLASKFLHAIFSTTLVNWTGNRVWSFKNISTELYHGQEKSLLSSLKQTPLYYSFHPAGGGRQEEDVCGPHGTTNSIKPQRLRDAHRIFLLSFAWFWLSNVGHNRVLNHENRDGRRDDSHAMKKWWCWIKSTLSMSPSKPNFLLTSCSVKQTYKPLMPDCFQGSD